MNKLEVKTRTELTELLWILKKNLDYCTSYERQAFEKWINKIEQGSHLTSKTLKYLTDLILEVRKRSKRIEKLRNIQFKEKKSKVKHHHHHQESTRNVVQPKRNRSGGDDDGGDFASLTGEVDSNT